MKIKISYFLFILMFVVLCGYFIFLNQENMKLAFISTKFDCFNNLKIENDSFDYNGEKYMIAGVFKEINDSDSIITINIPREYSRENKLAKKHEYCHYIQNLNNRLTHCNQIINLVLWIF